MSHVFHDHLSGSWIRGSSGDPGAGAVIMEGQKNALHWAGGGRR
jgi:hypothetical protein